jgi:hypothetical protein
MKRLLAIQLLIILIWLPVEAQTGQQDLKREVTLYNPYKPSLSDVKKRSFLPDLNDTTKTRPDFNYNISTSLFSPEYIISPIKAATLLPDPLPKLYKSFVNFGLGTYFSPLAELSITNERSKKGAVGLYARHFSTNGNVKLDNGKKRYAGYMDNDVSLFGKKFFRNNFLEGSVDFAQKVRHAYGYDTNLDTILVYDPLKKDIKLGFNDLGASISFASLTLDSASFSYDFDVNYNIFYAAGKSYQHNAGFTGTMAKTYKGFYAGSGLEFEYYRPSALIWDKSKYIAGISPFIKKSTPQWNFKLGFQMILDKDTAASAKFHFYPDVRFGFTIVPSYISLFAGLNGMLEKNEPMKIVEENPFLVRDGSLFLIPNTSHSLIVSAGLMGNTGIGGNYLVSASYSLINNMIFYSNLIFPGNYVPEMGNYFISVADDAEVFKLHGEINGEITDKISYTGNASWYNYTVTYNKFAFNRPNWDGKICVRYNLRDKILAGAELTAIGKRRLSSTIFDTSLPTAFEVTDAPVHFNLNLSAEYRYTKIMSFWLKLNNIANNRYYEWAYYPTQRFLCMVGFTYSL